MRLAMEYQQCAYLTGRYDEAEAWIEQMLTRARTNLEKAEILSMRTRQYATTGKMVESDPGRDPGVIIARHAHH